MIATKSCQLNIVWLYFIFSYTTVVIVIDTLTKFTKRTKSYNYRQSIYYLCYYCNDSYWFWWIGCPIILAQLVLNMNIVKPNVLVPEYILPYTYPCILALGTLYSVVLGQGNYFYSPSRNRWQGHFLLITYKH